LESERSVYHDVSSPRSRKKSDFKVAKAVNTVEKQLTEQKRAVTYGIYFDFNKDTIKKAGSQERKGAQKGKLYPGGH